LPPVVLILFQDGYNLTPCAKRAIRHNAYPAVALLRNCPYAECAQAAWPGILRQHLQQVLLGYDKQAFVRL